MAAIDQIVRARAVTQHGLITFTQVNELGGNKSLVARRIDAGLWRRTAPGVYIVGAAPITYQQRVLAHVLSLGPGAAASHRCACRLRALLPRRAAPVEASVPNERTPSRRAALVHRSRDLEHADIEIVDGIPFTGVARTLLDLGAVAPDDVLGALNQARRRHLVDWDDPGRVR